MYWQIWWNYTVSGKLDNVDVVMIVHFHGRNEPKKWLIVRKIKRPWMLQELCVAQKPQEKLSIFRPQINKKTTSLVSTHEKNAQREKEQTLKHIHTPTHMHTYTRVHCSRPQTEGLPTLVLSDSLFLTKHESDVHTSNVTVW